MRKSSTQTSSVQKYEKLTLLELSDLLDNLTDAQESGTGMKATAKEEAALRLAIQQRQRQVKAKVMEFELTNTHHLLFFASTNGFVKLAGHSALFFAATVANRLHWRYSLKLDTDRYSPSDDGVISFRSLDRITARLAEINIFPDDTLSDDELYFFQLPKAYSTEQIEKLRDQTQDDIRQIMNIVLPNSPIPLLYDAIMQASQMVYYQFKHLSDSLAKDTIGQKMILMTVKMAEAYHQFARTKEKDSSPYLKEIITLSRELRYDIAYASKIQILHHRDARKVLEPLIAAERIATKAYSRQRTQNGTKS